MVFTVSADRDTRSKIRKTVHGLVDWRVELAELDYQPDN